MYARTSYICTSSKLHHNCTSSNEHVYAYDNNLDLTKHSVTRKINVTLHLWLETNILFVIRDINEKVKRAIAGILAVDYMPLHHSFELSLISPTREKLQHGENIVPKLSNNLPNVPLHEISRN